MTFKKGYDPKRNLKGRPKLGMTLAERIREAIEAQTKDQKQQIVDQLVKDAIMRARKGSFQYWNALLDRAYGKVPDQVEMRTEQANDLSKLTDKEIETLTRLLEKAKSD